MSLKSALKEAKQLIGEGKNDEAIGVLQPLLDDGSSDYMLFCLAALATANGDKAKEAKQLYEKAIALDEKLPAAWQGMFKLYCAGSIPADDMGIKVCDRMESVAAAAAADDEKREVARQTRREMWRDLRRWPSVAVDMGESAAFARSVAAILHRRPEPTGEEKEALSAAFAALRGEMSSDRELNEWFVRDAVKVGSIPDWRDAVVEFCEAHGVKEDDDEDSALSSWLSARLCELAAVDQLVEGECEEKAWLQWQRAHGEGEEEEEGVMVQLLRAMQDGDADAAADVLESVKADELKSWPLCVAVIRPLLLDEAYEQAETAIQAAKGMPSAAFLLADLRGMECRCLLGRGGERDVERARTLLPLEERHALQHAMVQIRLGLPVDVALDGEAKTHADAVAAIRKGDTASAVSLTEQLLEADDEDVDYLVLAAEARMLAGSDPSSLLVKAAKLNPRASRVFHLLGKSLCGRNATKAIGCLERAAKIRPSNEEYALALDDALAGAGEKAVEQRIAALKRLSAHSSPVPAWVRARLGGLLAAAGDWDGAIELLQARLRENAEDTCVWWQLAEAYSQRGQLQSAVAAYGEGMARDGRSGHVVALIQVHLRLGEVDAAVEQCERWSYECRDAPTAISSAVSILHAEARLRKARAAVYAGERVEELDKVFSLLSPVLASRARLSHAYKLAGDALLEMAAMGEEARREVELPPSLPADHSPPSVLRAAGELYASVVSLRPSSHAAWADLAVPLCRRGEREKARECMQRALSLCSNQLEKSGYWCRLAGMLDSPEKRQHALCRALQLHRNNAEAWLRLGLLYVERSKMDEAHKALNEALRLDPEMAEGWCGWALIAEAAGSAEAADLFRQSVTLKPTTIGVSKLSAHISSDLKKGKRFEPSTAMLDVDRVIAMKDTASATPQLKHLVGVMAELFGHYESASTLLSDGVERTRCLLKLRGMTGVEGQKLNVPGELKALERLAGMPTDGLYELLLSRSPLYAQVMSCLSAGLADELRPLLLQHRKELSVPLIVGACVRFNVEITADCLSALLDMRPRHELMDVWPVETPEGIETEEFIETDGEPPFRFRHAIAKPLFDVLSSRRSELLEKKETAGAEVDAIEAV